MGFQGSAKYEMQQLQNFTGPTKMFLSDANWVLGKFRKFKFLEEKEMKGNERQEGEEKGQAVRNYWQTQKLSLNDGGKNL